MGRAILITIAILFGMFVLAGIGITFIGEGVGSSIPWLIVIGCAIWAALDASKMEVKKYQTALSGPVGILFGTVLLWIIVFPWYLVVRQKIVAGEMPRKASGGASQAPDASSPVQPVAPGHDAPGPDSGAPQ